MPQNPNQVLIGLNGTTPIAIPTFTGDKSLSVSQTMADYYRPVFGGLVFSAANQTGQTTSAGLATTYTGLCLSNPAASTANLIVIGVSAAMSVAPSTITSIGLIAGYSAAGVVTHTTPATVRNEIVGSTTTGQGLADTACTIVGTPYWDRFIAQCSTATTAGFGYFDLKGAIVIPPGGYLAIGTSIASPANSLLGSLHWIERPIAG